MKQLVLRYRTGAVVLLNLPVGAVRAGAVLVRNACSTVSAGTEKLITDLARKNLLGKALARADLVRQAIAEA